MTARPRNSVIWLCLGLAGVLLVTGTFLRGLTLKQEGPVTTGEAVPANIPRSPSSAAREWSAPVLAPAVAREQPLSLLQITVMGDNGGLNGAELVLRADTGEEIRKTTNSDGEAAVKLPGPGHVSVEADAEGYQHWEGETEVDENGNTLEIVLTRSSRLSGRVIGYTGQEANLSVGAISGEDETNVHSVSVSESGEFDFGSLAPGAYAVALRPDLFKSQELAVNLAPGEHATIELSLPQTGGIELTAIFAARDDTPREASLRLVNVDDQRQLHQSLTLQSQAPESLNRIPVGSYYALLDVKDTARLLAQRVDVAVGRTIPLTFTWPSGRIDGRVVTDDGPANGARVLAWKIVPTDDGREVRDNAPEQEVHTESDGAFALAGLSDGRYLVTAEREEASDSREVTLSEGRAQGVDLTLQWGTTAEARVMNGDTPVEGALVLAVSEPHADTVRSGTTDARGYAHFGFLPNGNYLIRATWYEEEDGPQLEARTQVNLNAARDSGVILLQGCS